MWETLGLHDLWGCALQYPRYKKGISYHHKKHIFKYLDHFCAWLEDVIVPIFKNKANLNKFSQFVSNGKVYSAN